MQKHCAFFQHGVWTLTNLAPTGTASAATWALSSNQLEIKMPNKLVVIGALATVALAGCVTRTIEKETVMTPAPAPTTTVVQTAPATAPAVVAGVAPPPAHTETIPPAPSADSVWVPGYWNWSNGQYTWVPGRYEAGRVGYRWVPQRWENINGQWHMTGGAWVRQ